ncbi:MAG TPA: hypothetical protein DGH68_04055 [Bacteroidetes bacterium]|jgi:hypothetical protein|nr:hypothetical protein [Bacteroidota bacterium]
MQPHIVLGPSTNVGVTISGTTGVALPAPDNNVVAAILTIETADVRMRWDGTAPAQSGVDGSQLMKQDSVWEITGRDVISALRFVPVSASAFVTGAYIKGE